MSNQDKKIAQEHAARAARQMRHAANNAGEAAEAAADVVKDEVADTASKAKNSAKDLAAKAIGTEVGRGVIAISLGLIALGVGVKKFQQAKQIRDSVVVVGAEGAL